MEIIVGPLIVYCVPGNSHPFVLIILTIVLENLSIGTNPMKKVLLLFTVYR